jgi:hypothetical protein
MITDIFAQLFLDMQQQIATIPEVKWIDQDYTQLETYQDGYRPSVLFPCVLIDFDEWQWEDQGKGIQYGEGLISVRIGFPPYTPTNALAPSPQREAALQHFEIERIVYEKLHGWSNGTFGKLQRRLSGTEKRNDNIRVRYMKFTSAVKDASAKPATSSVPRPDAVIGEDLLP